jgi:hypothetical protein
VSLVPLSAMGSALFTVEAPATVFGWFVSWISSVVILDLCFFELSGGKESRATAFFKQIKEKQ